MAWPARGSRHETARHDRACRARRLVHSQKGDVMDRVVNLEVLGRPINIGIIIAMIFTFWFTFYLFNLNGGLKLAPHNDEGAN